MRRPVERRASTASGGPASPERRTRRRARIGGALVLAAALFGGGCSTYRPISRWSLGPSHEVRVRLTSEYGAELQSIFRVAPTTLEGTVIRSDEAGFLLETVTAGIRYGARSRPLTQQVSIPWTHLVEVQEKQLDRGRTAAVVGGVGLLTLAVILNLFESDFGGTPPPGPGGNDEVRLPPVQGPR